jgi:hypothetical protein
VTVEDRLRATTQAVTTSMRPVRPLDLSAGPSPSPVHDVGSPDLLDAPPPRARRSQGTRRWRNWGAPVAAAALVTVLALVLVILRQVPAPPSGSGPAASSTATAASFPRYYVTVASTNPRSSAHVEAVVNDDRTGRSLAVISPFPGQNFYGVTAAADDRTFVLSSYLTAQQETIWYVLRLTPGAVHPAQLTKLPIKPLPREISGLALSPDGRDLAVVYRTSNIIGDHASTGLVTYSLSSGAGLGAWRTDAGPGGLPGGANAQGLSWVNGDRSVAFRWFAQGSGSSNYGTFQLRVLDVTAAGHDLLAGSRLVVQVPFATARGSVFSGSCETSRAASDGRTVVCGSDALSNPPGAACAVGPPSFVSYSTATGKPLQVLYQYRGPCTQGEAVVLWTDPSGSRAIGVVQLVNGKQPMVDLFGLVTGGHLTPLPALVAGNDALQTVLDDSGDIAF